MALEQRFPELFWEPCAANVSRFDEHTEPDVGAYVATVTQDSCASEAEKYPQGTNLQSKKVMMPSEIASSLGRAAREMAFLWHRFIFAGYYIKKAAPDALNKPLQFLTLYDTLKRRHKEIQSHLLWRDAYAWSHKLCTENDEVVQLMQQHDQQFSQGKLQHYLLSNLDDLIFRQVFCSVRDFIDFDRTDKLGGAGIKYIRTLFLILVPELMRLSLRESSMNEGTEVAFNSMKWKKDTTARNKIRKLVKGFPSRDEVKGSLSIRDFVLYDEGSQIKARGRQVLAIRPSLEHTKSFASEVDEHDLTYNLFGDLFLQNPEGLISKKRLKRLQELERPLQELNEIRDQRYQEGLRTFDYLRAFEEFREQETSLWEKRGVPGKPASELVPPSGSMRSPIAYHLHCPSFTTLHRHWGETADPTNPCIELVMNNGFSKGETLIFDHLSRREDDSGFATYPKDMLACHEAYQEKLRKFSRAAVEVVFGVKVHERLRSTLELEPLYLWGEHEGKDIQLEWETHDGKKQLCRILVFVQHPQRFLNGWWAGEEAIGQDHKLFVAGRLAGIATDKVFYQSRKWQPKLDHQLRIYKEMQAERQELAKESARCHGDDIRSLSPDDIEEEEEVDCAQISTQELRRILKAELKEPIDAVGQGHGTWTTIPDLPRHVQMWLRGQPRTLFRGLGPNGTIESVQDLAAAYRKHLRDAKPPQNLQSMVHGLMEMQSAMLDGCRESPTDEFTYYGSQPYDTVEVKCHQCGAEAPPDNKARWSCLRKNTYIYRTSNCQHCGYKNSKRYPQDSSLPHMGVSKGSLGQKAPQYSSNWTRLLANDRKEPSLPLTVDSWCRWCHEKTKTYRGSGTYTDKHPRWTKGTPAKYIERAVKCFTCSRAVFVPVTNDLPSICVKDLNKFVDRFPGVEDWYLIKVLENKRSSTKTSRF